MKLTNWTSMERPKPARVNTGWAIRFTLLLSCIPSIGVAATPYTFTDIDYPGVSYTYATGLNNLGQVVGYYRDSSNTFHGFLRSSAGVFSPIEYPGAMHTMPMGINNLGHIVGSFMTCNIPNWYGCRHPFVLREGVYTALPDAPGSSQSTTDANGINDSGQIVGTYVDADFRKSHGFLLSNDANYQTIDAPNFYSSFIAGGINNLGHIVVIGQTDWGNGTSFPFLLKDGAYQSFSITGPSGARVFPLSINAAGDLAGPYYPNGGYYAFVWSNGVFTDLQPPTAVIGAVGNSGGPGINNARQVVGAYWDANNVLHGFLASPTQSICLLYDPTKAVKSGATIPIKLQVCDPGGANLSSPTLVLHAVSITQTSSSISGSVQDSGNANPDDDFRFNSTLGGTGGYIFNLKTKGLSTGAYNLNFTIGSDSTSYQAPFQVK